MPIWRTPTFKSDNRSPVNPRWEAKAIVTLRGSLLGSQTSSSFLAPAEGRRGGSLWQEGEGGHVEWLLVMRVPVLVQLRKIWGEAVTGMLWQGAIGGCRVGCRMGAPSLL